MAPDVEYPLTVLYLRAAAVVICALWLLALTT